jgi:hypothetical protein
MDVSDDEQGRAMLKKEKRERGVNRERGKKKTDGIIVN